MRNRRRIVKKLKTQVRVRIVAPIVPIRSSNLEARIWLEFGEEEEEEKKKKKKKEKKNRIGGANKIGWMRRRRWRRRRRRWRAEAGLRFDDRPTSDELRRRRRRLCFSLTSALLLSRNKERFDVKYRAANYSLGAWFWHLGEFWHMNYFRDLSVLIVYAALLFRSRHAAVAESPHHSRTLVPYPLISDSDIFGDNLGLAEITSAS
ncbi:hypothetical protein TEA_010515 [Camellia sinensis var. sinensis]|uniref:Uncharacterized protein n=1 Tax=Camellia sinensis var. sinensis TaxID=542762 RepID=A0A4S4EJN5_CAMSN|nr:hypothetical protein TEA_010515 [Camellia sinensis var. sinensis]